MSSPTLRRLPALLLVAGLGVGCGHREGTGGGLVGTQGVGASKDLSFGNVPLGQTRELALIVSNSGTGPLGLLNTTISGTNVSDFKLAGQLPTSVAANQSVSIPVSFTPGGAGARQAAVVIDTDSATTAKVQANLTGDGLDLEICATPNPLTFGNTQVQGTPASATLQVQNCGHSAASVTFNALSGAQAKDFKVTGAVPTTLQPGASLSVTVAYSPHASGPSAASLPVVPCQGCQPQPIALAGTGIDGQLAFNPGKIDFGNVPAGQSSTATVAATNVGTAPLTLNLVNTGSSSSIFALSGNSLPANLAPGQSFEISVTYTPSGQAGGDSDTLRATYSVNDPAVAPRTLAAALFGNEAGGPCSLSISPPALSFGNVSVGANAQSQVTITNGGGQVCEVSSVALGANSDPGFTLPANQPTSFTVVPGASIYLTVDYATSNANPPFLRQGALTFVSSDVLQPTVTVPLSAYYDSTCSQASQWIYTVDLNGMLSSFDPVGLAFHDVGILSCPTDPYGGQPFSMGVDQSANAWVLYSTGEIYEVNAQTAACQATSFQPGQSGVSTFGMGFSFDPQSGSDTLYIASPSPTSMLASIAFPSLALNPVASLAVGRPELTGTADGELWGFFPEASPPIIAQIDTATGALGTTYDLPGLAGNPNDWAVGFYGNAFWIFLQRAGELSTTVYEVNRANGVVTTALANTGRSIVGAGVSTCAPVVAAQGATASTQP